MFVNFDNAATTFPKPQRVRMAAQDAISRLGGNSGRGGHTLTMITSEAVYNTRQATADFFGAETENVIFTLNCTHALNIAIQGIMSNGGHIIISSLEHNSVARPVHALSKKNVTYSIAEVSDNDEQTVNAFRELITPDTKAIACTIASNVTGQILPYKRIAALCQANNICFIADGAQACGIIDIKMTDGINILCTPGHKGLYGPAGTGILISDGKYNIPPLMYGGTGSSSLDLEQPDFLPDCLESGTINTLGIIALKYGIDFVQNQTCKAIYKHEDLLCRKFIEGLKYTDRVKIYRNSTANYAPIVSFTIDGISPEDTAAYLNKKGFCMRAGLHCAPLAHKQLGTTEGTVRFSPSVFNTEVQTNNLIRVIKNIK